MAVGHRYGVIAGKTGVAMAPAETGGRSTHILHSEVLQAVRADEGADLLLRATVGGQLSAVGKRGAEIAWIQEKASRLLA